MVLDGSTTTNVALGDDGADIQLFAVRLSRVV